MSREQTRPPKERIRPEPSHVTVRRQRRGSRRLLRAARGSLGSKEKPDLSLQARRVTRAQHPGEHPCNRQIRRHAPRAAPIGAIATNVPTRQHPGSSDQHAERREDQRDEDLIGHGRLSSMRSGSVHGPITSKNTGLPRYAAASIRSMTSLRVGCVPVHAARISRQACVLRRDWPVDGSRTHGA